MKLKQRFETARTTWQLLTLYERFEHVVILVLSGLISIIVALAVWNLVLKLAASLVLSSGFDPTDYSVFQSLFGTILIVIIALEFNRSLLVIAERRLGIVQVRTIVLIALLAIVRKLMVIDLSATEANQLFALSAAILVLGCVFWLVREQDRREKVADEP